MAYIDFNQNLLRCEFTQKSSILCDASVFVARELVDVMYAQAIRVQQNTIQAQGFRPGAVPFAYIADNFKLSIDEHLKEFLFNFFVVNFLFQQIRDKKMLVAGDPRLIDIQMVYGQEAVFVFLLSVFPTLDIQEWRHLPFKAPKRKKYKDLDRQVDSFIKQEKGEEKKMESFAARVGDWVAFDLVLVDDQGLPIIDNHKESFWFKVGDEDVDKSLKDLFLNKSVGDRFCTQNGELQSYFSAHFDTNYKFCITITDILHSSFFCLEQFKAYFKIKTNRRVYEKLIEVFSYRNDLSQWRSMAEGAIKLILERHRFDVPSSLVLRQQKMVLEIVYDNPDYHVYRVQKDFRRHIRQLAEKQVKEMVLLDQLAYNENIVVSHQDVKYYLNLAKRARTKEFIYFNAPALKISDHDSLVPVHELVRLCLREKTLNHIIYHLTKV